jgi:ribosome-binding factor A
MPGPSRKAEHLSARIQHKLSAILQKEANDPRFQRVTITGVELARDLGFAKVRFAVFPEAGEEQLARLSAALNRAAGFFSHALARSWETRAAPRLRFEPDRSFDEAERIDRVLDRLEAKRE